MSCKKCGSCCRVARIFQLMDEEERKWWELHGKTPIKARTSEEVYYIDFPLVCKELDGSKCKIYENRPIPCREFDCSNKFYDFEPYEPLPRIMR